MADETHNGLDESDLRDVALRYLARRDYGEAELARKLTQRGAQAGTAREVVAELAAEGLVDDERFAELFARQRVERHYGPLRIRAELRSRGVEDEVASGALEPYREHFEQAALDWLRQRRRGALDHGEKGRLYRSGMQRGFSHDHLMRALDRLVSEA